MGSDPIFTQDPGGNVMVGEPIKPAAAYPTQNVPNPYYYQPPVAYYQPTAPPIPSQGVPSCQSADPPPQFYYGMPTGAVPNYPQPLNTGVQPYGASAPHVANTTYLPHLEVVADFSANYHTHTDLPPTVDCNTVTHVNFHDNKLTRICGLSKYPNLLRLTVSWNDLRSLQGVHEALYLRWIDGSGNYLTDFTGMSEMPSLEWLDLTQSDITSFRGLHFAPNLMWLCLHHNRFNQFKGIEALPMLQFLDVSDNEVRDVTGLEKGLSLREINMCNNPTCEGDVKYNVASIKKLASLPNLVRLNITDTFYDPEEAEVVAHFKQHAPNVEVVITEERTAELGHNYKFKGKDVSQKKKASCCTIA